MRKRLRYLPFTLALLCTLGLASPGLAGRGVGTDRVQALEQAWSKALEGGGSSSREALHQAFRPRFLALAGDGHLGAALWLLEEDAVENPRARLGLYQALVWGSLSGNVQRLWRIITLLEGDSCLSLGEVEGLARYLAEHAHEAEVRAGALLALARRTAPPACESATRQQAAGRLCSEVSERWPKTRAARGALDLVWRMENLAVGRRAPEFLARDARGNELRSQHLRGRVVVVDVWRFTSPGQGRALAEQQLLRSRLWDEPFTWLGVNLDPDQDAFVRSCDDRDIDWRQHAWEGGAWRGICEAWHVGAHKLTVLLDDGGVVRGVDLKAEELESRISGLLRDLKGRKVLREEHLGGGVPEGR